MQDPSWITIHANIIEQLVNTGSAEHYYTPTAYILYNLVESVLPIANLSAAELYKGK